MRSERQKKIEDLFARALACPAAAREAFLEEHCSDDAELRASVEALLRSDERAGSFLGQLVTESGEELPPTSTAMQPGRCLGPYRLLRRVGEGGMSTVFLADRVDGSFQRPVVIKVIRQGMESGDTLRRLRQERQILAGLEHPWIARLYDGGATEERLPYFVMELVEGTALDVHGDQRRLTVGERLELFRKVCAAVQYAHQNLVVHRDLKPSNILVTATGEPKLLDFGIAKLLDPTLIATPAEPTAAWARLMTPNYASPEQILGRRITTASDVYLLPGRPALQALDRLTAPPLRGVLRPGDRETAHHTRRQTERQDPPDEGRQRAAGRRARRLAVSGRRLAEDAARRAPSAAGR